MPNNFDDVQPTACPQVVFADDHADQIVAELKLFRDAQIKTHPVGKASIRVFVLPCTQAV